MAERSGEKYAGAGFGVALRGIDLVVQSRREAAEAKKQNQRLVHAGQAGSQLVEQRELKVSVGTNIVRMLNGERTPWGMADITDHVGVMYGEGWECYFRRREILDTDGGDESVLELCVERIRGGLSEHPDGFVLVAWSSAGVETLPVPPAEMESFVDSVELITLEIDKAQSSSPKSDPDRLS